MMIPSTLPPVALPAAARGGVAPPCFGLVTSLTKLLQYLRLSKLRGAVGTVGFQAEPAQVEPGFSFIPNFQRCLRSSHFPWGPISLELGCSGSLTTPKPDLTSPSTRLLVDPSIDPGTAVI